MREAGALTIAQDEASCVVYGMPGEAVKRGSVVETVKLKQIPRKLLDHAHGSSRARRRRAS